MITMNNWPLTVWPLVWISFGTSFTRSFKFWATLSITFRSLFSLGPHSGADFLSPLGKADQSLLWESVLELFSDPNRLVCVGADVVSRSKLAARRIRPLDWDDSGLTCRYKFGIKYLLNIFDFMQKMLSSELAGSYCICGKQLKKCQSTVSRFLIWS